MCSLDFGEIACNKYPVLLLLLLSLRLANVGLPLRTSVILAGIIYSYEWYFQNTIRVSLRPACVPLRTSVVFNGIQW